MNNRPLFHYIEPKKKVHIKVINSSYTQKKTKTYLRSLTSSLEAGPVTKTSTVDNEPLFLKRFESPHELFDKIKIENN